MQEQQSDVRVKPSDGVESGSGGDFKALYRKEQLRLGRQLKPDEGFCVSPVGTAQEPRVTYTREDSVGLALSGGGIRSATFNLGLLQGLDDIRVLEHVNYLSTVSGGGYIGGWWSAWRQRGNKSEVFPKPVTGAAEAEEIRHLREFSNFLTPRWGFFETETWNAVVAIVSVLLPALLVAVAVLAAALFAWVGAAWVFAQWRPLVMLLGLPLLVFVAFEVAWFCQERTDQPKPEEKLEKWRARLCKMCRAVTEFVVAPTTLWCVWFSLLALLVPWALCVWKPTWVGGTSALAQKCCGWWEFSRPPVWWDSIGIRFDPFPPEFNARLFFPAAIWGATALALMVLRLIVAWRSDWLCVSATADRKTLTAIPALDRVIMRLLGLALVWSVIGLLWFGGCFLQEFTSWLTGAVLAGGGGFAWLRKWIVSRPAAGGKRALPASIQTMLPQVLSYATVGMAMALVAGLLAETLRDNTGYWWFGAYQTGVVIVAAFLCFDPTEWSMHAFYRNRLIRAYLGASRETDAAKNRQTDVRAGDDLDLEHGAAPVNDSEKPPPLHLVCCAANDVGGDELPALSRGSRSAVLSPLGFAMGDCYRGASGLTLGSALTASAAAFNSNMGSRSMELGSAVTFLMSALNLRLGLWVPCRATGTLREWLPGWFFLREMFGCTKAVPSAGYVHLSDGAHFENLALYELVRRHCRYIIVSDCTADPAVAFEDFGNTVRRIREDFGIEIEVDLRPLLPGEDGRARQHMVVGTVHYDPVTTRGLDKGVLLYFKPTLSGDEPPDVLQYKTRNAAFPHEPTADQFYDEAQWESYRRLGEHAGRSALWFVREMASGQGKLTAQRIFSSARFKWHPAPPDIGQNSIELTKRFSDLEKRLQRNGPSALVRQVFPELEFLPHKTATPQFDAASMEQTLHVLLQVMQLMEDIWSGAHLDTHWNHPVNLGWLNYLQRWAYAPAFRLWWPLLKPQFNPEFRQFMEEHFKLPATSDTVAAARFFTPLDAGTPKGGLAWKAWKRDRPGLDQLLVNKKKAYWLELELPDSNDPAGSKHRIQVAVLLMEFDGSGNGASWDDCDLFLLPGLWASGIGSEFVRKVLDHLKNTKAVTTCRVVLSPGVSKASQRISDAGSRQEHLDKIEFYRGLNCQLDKDAVTLFRKL